jgi:hypothetical protein
MRAAETGVALGGEASADEALPADDAVSDGVAVVVELEFDDDVQAAQTASPRRRSVRLTVPPWTTTDDNDNQASWLPPTIASVVPRILVR